MKLFVPTFDESLRHLELIRAQIDLDKKIQKMSHLIDYAVKICERKSNEMDEKSKTKLDKSKKQEVRNKKKPPANRQAQYRLRRQEKHGSWISSNGSNLPHLLTKCKHNSGHQNASRWTNLHQSHLLALQRVKTLTCSPGKHHLSAHMTNL
jgi:hypothetical protein